MVDLEDIRAVTADLPRSYEVLVRDRIKFRVGQIVYLSVAPDEQSIGIGFPREERAAALAAEPDKFFPPRPSDERYQWIQVRLDALDLTELRELILDAWSMCVPKKVRAEYFGDS
ncbi:MmcQ/YjbR family DNA-binding protein [Kribbella solani]|uniref:MmcQ/YjbR family DNA-binding protein n=1 Tax=Kribbella solani TaxID=236067 RepID=UPI0029B70710|nr:MmcQ/YjbR family DNA-binding protein [Kribbella solani]MDX2970859.1 MmcQ/YjbR family DNA-binding protein [Kribbella solani]MDX3003704.1 MmcQ/YjbR family DNA-binding protein [Kribbella solani]